VPKAPGATGKGSTRIKRSSPARYPKRSRDPAPLPRLRLSHPEALQPLRHLCNAALHRCAPTPLPRGSSTAALLLGVWSEGGPDSGSRRPPRQRWRHARSPERPVPVVQLKARHPTTPDPPGRRSGLMFPLEGRRASLVEALADGLVASATAAAAGVDSDHNDDGCNDQSRTDPKCASRKWHNTPFPSSSFYNAPRTELHPGGRGGAVAGESEAVPDPATPLAICTAWKKRGRPGRPPSGPGRVRGVPGRCLGKPLLRWDRATMSERRFGGRRSPSIRRSTFRQAISLAGTLCGRGGGLPDPGPPPPAIDLR